MVPEGPDVGKLKVVVSLISLGVMVRGTWRSQNGVIWLSSEALEDQFVGIRVDLRHRRPTTSTIRIATRRVPWMNKGEGPNRRTRPNAKRVTAQSHSGRIDIGGWPCSTCGEGGRLRSLRLYNVSLGEG